MSHPFKISFIEDKSKQSLEVSGIFEDTEWDLLHRFEAEVDALLNTKLVLDGMSSSLNIKYNQDTGMSFSTELPPWDDVIVFLHRFRPLLLPSEATHFNRICNILERRLENDQLRQMFGAWRDMFSGKQMQASFRISSNDEVLNSEKVLQDWLNAYEFHRDQDKKRKIDDLHAAFPLDASKVLFIGMLQDKAKAAAGLADIIRVV